MASNFKFKLLSQLAKKREEGGFTLIELLVVVIIIGVLAAVALPNLLGQVGKARETELKNAAGTINRSQQSYHFEKQSFANGADSAASLNLMGIKLPQQYLTSVTIEGADGTATVFTSNTNAENDGTRGYSGYISYSAGEYSQILCQTDTVTADGTVPTDATTCAGNTSVIN